MSHLLIEFLAGLFIDFNESVDNLVVAPAPLSPKGTLGHFLFYIKGGERISCNPPNILPETSPVEPSAPKIRVLTYLLSEHKFLFLWPEAPQSYPDFASNLNFPFNRGHSIFLPIPIFTSSKFPSSPILLAFCYSIGIKNLTRRMQNVRIGILPVEPDNLPAYGAGGGGDFCVYEANWGESKAVP